MVALKPRVVIVGAGMAGLTAAHQLHRASCSSHPCFELTVLEASHRMGGRICTSMFEGDQVELGATWIHGTEGSPIHDIARRIGALEGCVPWERQDGFPGTPLVRAEGGLSVDRAIVSPIIDVYKKLMNEAREKGSLAETKSTHRSLGAFLRDSFNAFLSESANAPGFRIPILGAKDCIHNESSCIRCGDWSVKALQDGIFSIYESMERVVTSCNSLFDLDLDCEKEYEEYPGEHITIGKGYMSVLEELASALPSGTIQFGKTVERVVWNCSQESCSSPVVVECEDGSFVEADHVVVTVSLGVLKARTLARGGEEGLCRPVNGKTLNGNTHQLFEPPLPPWKLEAISRLGFGVVDKLFLRIDPEAGEELRSHLQFIYKKGVSKSNNIPWWMRKTYSLCPIYKGSCAVLAWVAGEEAMEMEKLTGEEIIDGVASTLAEFGYPLKKDPSSNGATISSSSDSEESWDEVKDDDSDEERGGTVGMFRGVLRSSWGHNPLFLGSYSYAATGSSGADFDTLAEPLPWLEQKGEKMASLQLLFAGEATDRHFYSTTHGAYRSGLREANRLLHHYGISLVEPL